MKTPMALFAIAAFLLFLCAPQMAGAQGKSLKERGYTPLDISASYAFYNDLQEVTNGGVFENVTAGYRKVEGAYEILIDLGWTEEILYVDFIEMAPAGPVADGIEYRRSVYGDGREEVVVSISVESKMGFYTDEKNVVP